VKIARDTSQGEGDDQNDKVSQIHQLREIMANPGKLKSLDLNAYHTELIRNNQQHLLKLIDKIIKELSNPFGDPRDNRSHQR
jgi:transcriptional accessory protein Tex/SPT6